MRQGRSKNAALAVYLPLFYGIWTLWEFWVRGLVDAAIPNEMLAQLVKSGLMKNLVWTLPALLLIHHFRDQVAIPLREMFSAKVHWGKYLPIFLAFTLYILTGAFLQKGTLTISDSFGIAQVIIILFVGLTEESVFRGWLLNAMVQRDNKWPSILCNAFLMLAIHFPVWLHTGGFFSNFANLGFVGIMTLSVIFSHTFLQSRSLLVPIALHMYWDLLVLLFL